MVFGKERQTLAAQFIGTVLESQRGDRKNTQFFRGKLNICIRLAEKTLYFGTANENICRLKRTHVRNKSAPIHYVNVNS